MILLGVSSSLTNHSWLGLSEEALQEAKRLTHQAGLNAVVAATYARLGAKLETLEQFTSPKLRTHLPDPSSLRDLDVATNRILRAIESRENIAIFADYDVDGAASAALLIEYFREFQIETSLYIPDRILEGYGPNVKAMKTLASTNSLIISVDCGSLAFDAIKAAREAGADVIILDHHMTEEKLPDAITVNPNRPDCTSNLGHLCAAGVVFLLLVALNRARGTKTPDLLSLLDLVALATVADVAALEGVNRAFVYTGLQVMNTRNRVGLRELASRLLPFEKINAEKIGFVLGPRLNAGGRIGRSSAAAELLTARTKAEAEQLVLELEAQNDARRQIEAKITEEAIAQIEVSSHSQNFVYAIGEDWHPGVLGVVASRLKSHFRKPALALAISGEEVTGSGRSVEGINLGAAIAQIFREGFLSKGGGHKMAAGLSLPRNSVEKAMTRLDEILGRESKDITSNLMIDAIISPTAISSEVLEAIEQAGPFGAKADAPIYAIPNVHLEHRMVLKEQHIRYNFSSSGQKFDVMAFGATNKSLDLGPNANPSNKYHLAVSVKRNNWQGRVSTQFTLIDLALAK